MHDTLSARYMFNWLEKGYYPYLISQYEVKQNIRDNNKKKIAIKGCKIDTTISMNASTQCPERAGQTANPL